jgi:hypothetical protein
MNAWVYQSHDNTEWVVYADDEKKARSAAYEAELTKTGSHAAAHVAARTVTAMVEKNS